MDPPHQEDPMAEMDEQQPRAGENAADTHAEHLARHGAPVPPPASPWAYAEVPAASPRRRGPGLLAAGLALAVVAVAGGAGFALGRFDHHGTASAGAPT